MTIDGFLTLNPEARPYGRGYRGPCPSCGGKNSSSKFSFTEREGKILVRCFAGCSITAICESLGLELKNLFVDSDLTPSQRQALPPQPKRLDWRRMSHDLEFASDSHWLRAENIFKAARQCEVSAMNDEALNKAWKCLSVGFHSLRVSENLGIIAFQIRVNGLADEARRHCDRKVTI